MVGAMAQGRVVVLIPQFVHDDSAGSRMQSMRCPNHFKDGNSENPWPGQIKMVLSLYSTMTPQMGKIIE
jgi:hypothetical protein